MQHNRNYTLKLTNYTRFLSLALTLVLAGNLFAQKTETESKKEELESTQEIFAYYEKQPEFPGGIKALMEFIKNEMIYPQEAIEKGVEGRVITNFVVEVDGSVTEALIVRGVDPLLDQEAIRIIEVMPKWKPAEYKGKAIRIRFTLPFVFDLNEYQEKIIRLREIAQKETYVPPPVNGSSEGPFINYETPPDYPGGIKALVKFIEENLRYPTIAYKYGIQGRVITNFIIHKDGSISDIQIVQGVEPTLDKEAVRVVKLLSKWIPGKIKGKPVDVRFKLPISFSLNEEKEGKFTFNEMPPEFPGGAKALIEFIETEMKYPQEAIEKGIEGRVITNFAVEKDGSITDIKIKHSVDSLLDQEALRIIKAMPKWEPEGFFLKIKSTYTLPIVFDLNEYQKENADNDSTANNDDEVCTEVDEQPDFPGGIKAMMSFLANNINYSRESVKKGVEGRVVTNFIVNKDGSISDVTVKKRGNKLLDAEAMRVI